MDNNKETDDWVDVPIAKEDSSDDWVDVPVEPQPVKAVDEYSTVENNPRFSKFSSALRGGLQGLSFGTADEIAGAITSLPALFNENDFADEYRKNRDISRTKNKLAEEQNPGYYTGGQLTGGLASMAIPVLGQVGNVARGAKAAQLARAGAVAGGLAGFGSSEADLTKGEIGQALLDTGVGAGTGAAFGVAAPKVLGVAGKGANLIDDFLLNMPSAALTKGADVIGSGLNQIGRSGLIRGIKANPSVAKEITNEGLDEALNSLGPLTSTPSGVLRDVQARMDSSMSSLDDIISKSDKSLDVTSYINKLAEKAKELRSQGLIKQAKGVEKAISEVKGNFSPEGTEQLSANVLNNLKKNIYEGINYSTQSKGLQTGQKQAGKVAKEIVEDVVSAGDDKIKQDVQLYNKIYGSLKPIKKAAEKSATSVNPLGGLLDTTAATAGAVTTGTPVGGIITAAARRSMPNVQIAGANVANRLGNLVKTAPQNFGKYANVLTQAAQRGGNSLAATNYVLQQSDPEYRQKLKELDKEGEQQNDF